MAYQHGFGSKRSGKISLIKFEKFPVLRELLRRCREARLIAEIAGSAATAVAVSWGGSPPPNPPPSRGGGFARHAMKTRAPAGRCADRKPRPGGLPLDGGGFGG